MSRKLIKKLDLKSWYYIIGFLLLLGMNQITFDPTDFLRLLTPILLAASFVLLGVFALTEIRKTIKKNYSTKTRNILVEIEGMRIRQKQEDLEGQIRTDQEILSLRESLKGFKRTYFENCVVYSAILFAITLLLTFIDLGKYLQIPNMVPLVVFFFWGLFYFSRMLQSIFFALNIVHLED
ncbi:hypothetical protein H8D91_01955 [archaeon]|nr:hypothetical protein [archaeon]